jgi:molybdenum cofactor cytidylyltransferase
MTTETPADRGPARAGEAVCAVLAAGASSRLRRPKQLVDFRGKPLLRHVVDAVGASSCAALAVVLGARANEIASVLEGALLAILPNDDWAQGIASSIRLATRWASSRGASALVLVLADQPLIDAAHVDRLVAAWRGGASVAASAYDGVLGVPAVLDATLFPDLLALEGDRGVARILRVCADAVGIPWPDGDLDVDTDADVLALAMLSRRTWPAVLDNAAR